MKSRLVQRPEDVQPYLVLKRVDAYRDFLAAVELEFSKQLIRINCEDKPEKTHISFCDAIENSLS